MTDTGEPDAAPDQWRSIDALIDWIGRQRAAHPTRKLAELIAGQPIPESRLIDVACIDLMQLRRLGQGIRAEDYLRDFPALATEANLLDLIDAELCVAGELGQTVSPDQYVRRFPGMMPQIRELMQLEQTCPERRVSGGTDFSLELAPRRDAPPRTSSQTVASQAAASPTWELPGPGGPLGLPIDLPPWFVAIRCVAGPFGKDGNFGKAELGTGDWLFQGRDSIRHQTLGLKLIALPASWNRDQTRLLLDACEAASKVTHPSWAGPILATVQRGQLAVIRPWIFARPWTPSLDSGAIECSGVRQTGGGSAREPRCPWRDLATVAFALAAAHRVGATHGGVHPGNLLVDHLGQIGIVDAAANRQLRRTWLPGNRSDAPAESIADWSSRRRSDVEDMIKLAITTIAHRSGSDRDALNRRLRQSVQQEPEDACAAIGEMLMREAAGGETVRPIPSPDNGIPGPRQSWLSPPSWLSRQSWREWFSR